MMSNTLRYPHRASALYAQKRQSTPQATPNRSWLFNRGASLLGIACVAERQHMELTQERLKHLLDYNPQNGNFTRRVAVGSKKAGDVAGTKTAYGYHQICIDRKRHLAHRLAFLWMGGTLPTDEIDHANGKRSDNRWCNIRRCTRSQNHQNAKIEKGNTSGVKGVYFSTKEQRWIAAIFIDKKPKRLGAFNDKVEAIRARQAAVDIHYDRTFYREA